MKINSISVKYLFTSFIYWICLSTNGQVTDSSSFTLNTRLSFYSPGEKGEIILHVPSGLTSSRLNVILRFGSDTICQWNGRPGKPLLTLQFKSDTSWRSGKTEAEIKIPGNGNRVYYCTGEIMFLKHKPNEVRIDRLTGGLIVNNLPFFPFGFYTYSPVYPTLPEEEVVKGFNLISPYQRIVPESLSERKKYMDRCAQLGMKVNYNLVSVAGNATRLLIKYFAGRMPVWIVPQAFGGGEHWLREPTMQEIRSMTWQAIIEGATGIQYFIRQGLNAFPKSTATWNECGQMALEVHSITPWLLSDEETIPVKASLKDISAASKMYHGQLLILAVNKTNATVPVQFSLAHNFTGKARVLFENRTVQVNGGIINDYIGAYGSQVYRIDINPPVQSVKPYKKNLISDPGFEDLSSPGIPSACYARPGSDRGATYFTDPRVKFEGNYSLQLVTPQENSGVTLRFFPVMVEPGKSYIISLWAKADPEQRFIPDKDKAEYPPQYTEVGVGDFHLARFVPGDEWRQYVTFVTIPQDTLPEIKTNVFLCMPGQGVAWFDMLQMIEDPVGKNKR